MTSLWDELATASWMANTGIPLVLTIAAILAGFRGVRRQMQNDRRLLAAQHRAEGAHALGSMVQKEARRMRHVGPRANRLDVTSPDLLDTLEQISWSIEDTGTSVLSDIPDALHRLLFVQRANEQVKYAWMFAIDKRNEAAKGWEYDDRHLDGVVESFLEPYFKRLEQAGRVLVTWDGYGPLPDSAPWKVGEIPDYGVWSDEGVVYDDEEDDSHYNAKVPLREFPLALDGAWERGLEERWRTIIDGYRAELAEGSDLPGWPRSI